MATVNLDIAFLPSELEGQDITNSVCIMLDIFRASTTIVTALENGCQAIYPVSTIEEATSLAATMNPVLLAGERKSVRIEGFDLGNSPLDFTSDKVRNLPVVMSTTNGTRAIQATAGAACSFIGSFRNAAALCRKVEETGKDVWIVCAGTEGTFSLEDSLCAGMLAERLLGRTAGSLADNVQAAIMLYRQVKYELAKVAGGSRNGRRLHEIGLRSDVEFCLEIDRTDFVPEYREGKVNTFFTGRPL